MAPYPQLFLVPRPAQKPTQAQAAAGVTILPLNIISLIISHLDNVADLACVCQASRVLHYMTLPQLYRTITLVSYENIRYKNEQAEGIGSASPFSMGLNALVTRNISTLVRTLALQGHWREHDLDEYSRAGRVPDDAMMLNIACRAAVDKCTLLETFKWDLNTKLLPNVYAGLASLQHLQQFYLRFPSSRSPRPTFDIPPMPSLRSFTMTEYDPLCFPDDISNLLLHATKLDTLKMHFSPRMRDACEPSVNMSTFFRRNIVAKRKLRLKTMQFYNLFALQNRAEIQEAVDVSVGENVTFLNTFGGEDDENQPAGTGTITSGGFYAFFDKSWANPPEGILKLKSCRHDRLSKAHAKMLGAIEGLERLYLVNARHKQQVPNEIQSGNGNGIVHFGPSPASSHPQTPETAPISSRNRPQPTTSVRDMYIDSICNRHGTTLRHLLLPARWQLPTSVIARLFRACPHITQLALAMECNSFEGMRMIVPFLKKLWAIRILEPTYGPEKQREFEDFMVIQDERHERIMGTELAKNGDFPELRFVGLGSKVWEIGAAYESTEIEFDEETGLEMEIVVPSRRMRRITQEDVHEVEIWRMDSLDVI